MARLVEPEMSQAIRFRPPPAHAVLINVQAGAFKNEALKSAVRKVKHVTSSHLQELLEIAFLALT